jgi:UDP-N-acetylglucosamine 2-epimerase (non-hydrolysing)
MPALMLAHPRTLLRFKEFGLEAWLRQLPGLRIEQAVGYLDFLNLLANARLVFTDSGGVQQEACIHQVPCVTLRDNTEWTETLEIGANRLAGCDPVAIPAAAVAALQTTAAWSNPFGDGTTASQIADVVVRELDRFRAAA